MALLVSPRFSRSIDQAARLAAVVLPLSPAAPLAARQTDASRLPAVPAAMAQPAVPARSVAWFAVQPAPRPAAGPRGTSSPAAGDTAGPRPQTAAPPASPPLSARPRLRPARLEPPRRPKELAWLTWQLAETLREPTTTGLRQTLRWRARSGAPLPPAQRPIERSRFGLGGEHLALSATPTVCDLLFSELREITRTLEASLSWSERNYRLAMHSTRLGQLCRELEARGVPNVLTLIRAGLARLWD
jgi:hypothetical protein